MLEERYIGLALAVSGTVAIGSSFIITKKACPRNPPFLVGRPLTSPRVSTMQQTEGAHTHTHPMIMHTSKTLFGGQAWQSVSARLVYGIASANINVRRLVSGFGRT